MGLLWDLEAELRWERHLRYTILHNQERIMSAIENANAALATLTADVAALAAKPAPAPGVPEEQVQAIADGLAAIDAQVKSLLG